MLHEIDQQDPTNQARLGKDLGVNSPQRIRCPYAIWQTQRGSPRRLDHRPIDAA